jgi:hypothetical protein
MRDKLGVAFMVLGYAGSAIFGLWAFILELRILADIGGLILALVGFFLFPALLTIAPFYAGFSLGDWLPLKVTIAGVLMFPLFAGLGAVVMKVWKKS